MTRLSTTSFGVLSLLAIKPWSAYELTKEMRMSLSRCWPRAETRIYQEPKNLVARGLAEAVTEEHRGRRRTVYTITERGREELRAWMAENSEPPVFESEGVLRLVFAEHGKREDLVRTLAQLEQQARQIQADTVVQGPKFIASVGATAERLSNMMLAAEFVRRYTDLLAEWAAEARHEVENRPLVWPPGYVTGLLEQLAQATEHPPGQAG